MACVVAKGRNFNYRYLNLIEPGKHCDMINQSGVALRCLKLAFEPQQRSREMNELDAKMIREHVRMLDEEERKRAKDIRVNKLSYERLPGTMMPRSH